MKSPATRLTVCAKELTAGPPAVVSRPYRPVPARKRSVWLKVCAGSLSKTVTSPEAWSLTMMSGSPSPFTLATVMSDGATPAGTIEGAANCPGEV